jgi:hypothetical protein
LDPGCTSNTRVGKLSNEELHDLNYSPNIIRMIQKRRMRWTGLAARLGERRGV